MQVTTDDGCRIEVTAPGNSGAPHLILLNSLGTDMSLWDAQVAPLSEHRRVWRYDSRGHGRSDVPAGEYTIARLGRDVLSLMDQAGIARADLCGISIGGLTGLWLATNAADRIGRLVLANTAARIGSVALWDERIAAVRAQGVAALVDGAMGRWFTPGFRARESETVARIRATFLNVDPVGYLGCCSALRDGDLRAEAPRTQAPTLVIAGAQDTATPPLDGQWLAGQIRGAAYVQLDAAHLSNIECDAEFTQTVLDFLRADDHG